jgi:hypothetical protein
MGNDWSHVCKKQFSRSPSQQKQANYGSGIFAVNRTLRFCLRSPCSLQVVTFGCAAVFSGIWFALWIRMEIRRRREYDVVGAVWRNLGRFSGLVLLGCVAGAVAWFAFMMATEYQFQANAPSVTARQRNVFIATSLRWYPVWDFLYPVEVLCLILCLIMLLRRLAAQASHGNSSHNAPPRPQADNITAWHCITDLAPDTLQRAKKKNFVLLLQLKNLLFYPAQPVLWRCMWQSHSAWNLRICLTRLQLRVMPRVTAPN